MSSEVQIINMYLDWQYQPRSDMNWGGGGDQGELMGKLDEQPLLCLLPLRVVKLWLVAESWRLGLSDKCRGLRRPWAFLNGQFSGQILAKTLICQQIMRTATEWVSSLQVKDLSLRNFKWKLESPLDTPIEVKLSGAINDKTRPLIHLSLCINMLLQL